MDATARANFPAFLLECGEGETTWMYLDQARPPNVTIGRGNLLPSLSAALHLEWANSDGSAASGMSVQTAWARIVSHPELARFGGMSEAWKNLTGVRASQASLDSLISSQIDHFETTLRQWWPGWDAAPGPAQEALMRICWAVGPGRLDVHWPTYWPRLHAAWCAQDWAACSRECRIPSLDATEPIANSAEASLFASCVENSS